MVVREGSLDTMSAIDGSHNCQPETDSEALISCFCVFEEEGYDVMSNIPSIEKEQLNVTMLPQLLLSMPDKKRPVTKIRKDGSRRGRVVAAMHRRMPLFLLFVVC